MWATAIPMMVQAGTSIAGALMSDRDAFDETRVQDQVNALEASRVYEEAAINPASPHFRALQKLQEAEIKRNIMQAIDSLVRSQNRNRARGVMGLLANPERRDESIAGAIGNMFAQSGDQARKGAQASLQNASQSARSRASGYGSINNLLRDYSNQNQATKLGSLEALGEMFKTDDMKDALEKIFGGSHMGGSGPAEGSFRAAQEAGMGVNIGNILKSVFVSR